LCEPSSELHIQDSWYPNTALDDLLGVCGQQVNIDRLYAGLDRLLPHKAAIEQHLKDRLGVLFDLKYDLLLYDLTSTYFEGQCPRNPMARRGYSRDHRSDCLQVVIALVVTEEGMPIGYEVFDGNQNDSKTVQQMVTEMEQRHGKAQRVWVFDRGCVSEANLSFLRERGGQYLVGTPRAMLKRFEQHLTQQGWQEVQAGVEVKLVPGPEGDETFVLARSRDRVEKEKAMHQRFVQRMEEGLNKLAAAADSGRLREMDKAGRRLGRLQAHNSRTSAAFTVTITPLPPARGEKNPGEKKPGEKKKKPRKQPTLSITWKREQRWDQWAALSEGCYLLRTNLNETDPCVLWKRYTQLTDAEWAFRINKDELRIRPIWHQRSDRVKAHILICFLAYAMWKTLGGWMSRSGLGQAPRPVLEQMKAIKSGDVVLPTMQPDGTCADTLRLRCVTTPNEHQEVLLNRLGLVMPQRIRTLQEAEALLA
jgi:transposase